MDSAKLAMLIAIYHFKEKRQELDQQVDTLKQTEKDRQIKIQQKIYEVDSHIDQMEAKLDKIMDLLAKKKLQESALKKEPKKETVREMKDKKDQPQKPYVAKVPKKAISTSSQNQIRPDTPRRGYKSTESVNLPQSSRTCTASGPGTTPAR